jgi:hypothetical protein
MKKIKFTLTIFLILLSLVACSDGEKPQSSMQGTAETFVQALIDGDEKTVDKLNRDDLNPTDYVMSDLAPKFSGLKLKDFTFETDKDEQEVKVKHDNLDGIYWLTIEKNEDKFYITSVQ